MVNLDSLTRKVRTRKLGRVFVLSALSLFLISIGLLKFSQQASADINRKISYQGKLTDSSSRPVADGSYDMKFILWDAASGGNCEWTARGTCGTPTARSVSVSNGIFSILLGDTGDNSLSSVDFNQQLWIGITVESDSEMTPRREIGAVTAAFNSDKLDGLDTSATGGTSAFVPVSDSNGNLTMTGTPQGSGVGQGVFYINPASATANYTLFGVAVGGSTALRVDTEGDLFVTGDATISGQELYIGGANTYIYGDNTDLKFDDSYLSAAIPISESGETGLNGSFTAVSIVGALNELVTGTAGLWADGGTYIYPTTAGTSSLAVTDGGDVGIGTTGPTTALDVRGNALFQNTSDSTTAFQINESDTTNLFTVNTTNGMIGLGGVPYYSSGVSPIQIRGALNTSLLELRATSSSVTGYNEIRIYGHASGTSTRYAAIRMTNEGNTLNNSLGFLVGTGSGQLEALRLQYNTGYVGIGTTNPGAKLDVAGGIDLTGNIDMEGDVIIDFGHYLGYNANNNFKLTLNPDASINSANNILLNLDADTGESGKYFAIYTDGQDGAGTELLRATDTGNVGIGITSPSTALHVAGSSGITIGVDETTGTPNVTGLIDLISAGDNAYSTTIQTGTQTEDVTYTLPLNNGDANQVLSSDGSGVLSWIDVSSGAGSLWTDGGTYIYPTTAGSSSLVVTDSGNVAIGTTSTSARLQVEGSGDIIFNQAGDFYMPYAMRHYGDSDTSFKFLNNEIRLVVGGDEQIIVQNTTQDYVKIGNDTDVDIYLSGGSSNALFVEGSSSNIGIGTSTPLTLLHVNQTGDYRATPTLSFGDGDTGIYQHVDNQLYFSMGGTRYGVMGGGFLMFSPEGTSYPAIMREAGSSTNPIYSFYADTDTGVGWAAADILSLIAGGTNGLNVNSSGYVGIGTTNPSETLEIAGHLKVSNPDSSTVATFTGGYGQMIDVTDSSGFDAPVTLRFISSVTSGAPGYAGVYTTTSHPLGFGTNNNPQRLYINTSGDVGIGTTAPATALHVAGSSGITIGVDETAGTPNVTGVIDLISAGDNAYSTTIQTGTQTGDITYTLPVNDGDTSQVLSSNGSGVLSWIDVSSGAGSLWTDGGSFLFPTDGDSLRIGDEDWLGISGSDERIVFDTAGDISLMDANVGIGTTNPLANLQVGNYSAITSLILTGPNSESLSSKLSFQEDTGGHGLSLRYDSDGNLLNFYEDLTNTPVMSILRAGNVGVGTTSPNGHLEIQTASPVVRITNSIGGAGDEMTLAFRSGQNTVAYDRAVIKSTVDSSPPYYGNLTFSTGRGTVYERMRIATSGNVGIGTTAPGAELEVAGDIKTETGWVGYSSGQGYISNSSWTGLLNSTAHFYINLDSNNNDNARQFRISKDAEDTSGTELFRVDESGIVALAGDGDTYWSHPAADTLAWTIGGSESMRLNSTGLGVGTTSPGERLDVGQNISLGSDSAADNDYLYFDVEAEYLMWDNTDDRFEFSNDVHASSFVTGSTLIIHDDYIRDSANINLQADSDSSNYLSISTGREVGSIDVSALYWNVIGTYTNYPGFSLNDSGQLVYRDQDESAWTTLDGLSASLWTDGGSFLYPTDGDSLRVGDEDWIGIGGSDERIIFDNAGDISVMGANLGIGTTNPGELLEVAGGNVLFTRSDSNNIVLTVSSTEKPSTGNIRVGGSRDSSTTASVGGIVFHNYYSSIDSDIASITSYLDSGFTSQGVLAFQVNNGTSLTEYMRIDHTGNVGIGTTSPSQELEVNGDIRLDANGSATTNGLCHSGADSDTTFSNRDIVACSAAPGDIAEWYDTKNGEAGDIVYTTGDTITFQSKVVNAKTGEILNVYETLTASVVEKSNRAYQANVLGVISTSPYETFGKGIIDYANNPNPVALNGRVPVKVTSANGPIRPGDPITTSNIRGVGMRSTKAGPIVGIALDYYDSSDPNEVGKVLVAVNLSWYEPEDYLNQLNDMVSEYDQLLIRLSSIEDNIILAGSFNSVNVNNELLVGNSFRVDTVGNIFTDGSLNVKGLSSFAQVKISQSLSVVGDVNISGEFVITSNTGFSMQFGDLADNKLLELGDVKGETVFAVDEEGNVEQKGADVKYFKNNSGRELVEGEVVVLDTTGNLAVTVTSKKADENVLGIIVKGGKDGEQVGVTVFGVTNVIIDGEVKVGDYLVSSSTKGRAETMQEPPSNAVIGKVLGVDQYIAIILLTARTPN